MKKSEPLSLGPLARAASLLVVMTWSSVASTWASDEGGALFDVQFGLSPATPAQPMPSRPPEPGRMDETATLERFHGQIQSIRLQMNEGRYGHARTAVENMLTVYGEVPVLLNLAAQIETRLGRLDRAETYWARMAQVDPFQPEVFAAWGGVLLHLREYEQAEHRLNQALTLEPYAVLPAFHLLGLYNVTGRHEEARALLRAFAAKELGWMAKWLDGDYDALIRLLGESEYVRLGNAILKGGEVEMDADAAPAEEMRQRLRESGRLLDRLDGFETADQWTDLARVTAEGEAAPLGLTAPAFRALAAYARFRAGTEEGSLHELAVIADRYPGSLHAQLRLGEALMERGLYAEAEERLRGAFERYPRHLLAYLLLVCAVAESGKADEALDMLKVLDAAARPFVVQWLAASSPYQQTLLTDEAYEGWRTAYLADGDAKQQMYSDSERPARDLLSTVLREVDRELSPGNLTAAARAVRRGLALHPESDALLFRAGTIAMLRRQDFIAEDYFARLAARHPDDAHVQTLWGGALFRSMRFDQAAEVLDRALELQPTAISARFNRAVVDAARGQQREAIGLLRALRVEEYGQVLAWLAQEMDTFAELVEPEALRDFVGFAVLGGYEPRGTHARRVFAGVRARSWSEDAALPSGDSSGLSTWLGGIARAIHAYLNAAASADWDAARQHLQQARLRGARSPVIELEEARIRFNQGDDVAAFEAMADLLDDYPGNGSLRSQYGFLLLERAQYARAENVFREALALRRDNTETLFGLACALAQQGKNQEAVVMLRRLDKGIPEPVAEWVRSQPAYSEGIMSLLEGL